MDLIIKGSILGFIMVLPGMSGGTVLLIFGLYEKMVNDLLKLNIRPYIPLVVGIIIGVFISGFTFAMFFENYRDLTVAFLLGCLLASIRAVLRDCPKINNLGWMALVGGGLLGFLMVGEPLGLEVNTGEANWVVLLVGGAISSAAMIIPGVPGSSVLIILGIYDVILSSIAELDYINLLIFGTGSVLGITMLLKILGALYERYKVIASYFFAGLIFGSARGVLPSTIDTGTITVFLIGFVLVWIWGGEEKRPAQEEEIDQEVALVLEQE